MKGFAFCSLWSAVVFASAAFAQQDPPKKAASPFLVFVSASPKGEPAVVEDILEAREELEKRLKKNKKWFRIAESAADAEITVDVEAYWVREERRTHDQRHVAGSANHTIQVDTIYRHHSLRAMTRFFGSVKEMTGTQVKRGGGNSKGAAKDLADRLERHCKENYWALEEKQKARTSSN